MSRYSNTLTELFEAYGNDATAALEAYGNVDNEGWSEYTDRAAEKQYRFDYGSWLRGQVRATEADSIAAVSGQARLFEVEPGFAIDIRTTLILDGVEYDVGSLAGADGADVLRKVAARDLKPAKTTIVRCKGQLALADHIVAESERLGRDVCAAEVLGWSQAA
jgi:hypothetical protein